MKYRLLRIKENERLLYDIEGILETDILTTHTHTVAEDVQPDGLSEIVGPSIAERAIRGYQTFDLSVMTVTPPKIETIQVMNQPCSDCPFRKKSLAGWLGSYGGPREILDLVNREVPYPCHMTINNEPGQEELYREDTRLCAGALLYMSKSGKLPRDPELVALVKARRQEDKTGILTASEFISHHNI